MERMIAIACSLLCLPIWSLLALFRTLHARQLPSAAQNQSTLLMELRWPNTVTRYPLLTVALGRLRLIGPAVGSRASQQFAPGLCSPEQLQNTMGLEDTGVDIEFMRSAGAKAKLGLLARAALVKVYGQHEDQAAHSEVRIFGVQFSNTTMAEAVTSITAYCQHKAPMKRVFFVNADCLNVAYGDRDYHFLLHDADLVLPDGSGVRMALKSLGTDMLGNLNGTDLFPRLCEAAAKQNLSIYLLGGQPGIAERTALNTMGEHPNLRIVGWNDGYFSEDESAAVVDKINQSGADILLVGLGAPRQERWLSENAPALQPAVGIGVGGLFDYYSGEVVRAPMWMREAGLEWVWRIIQQPGEKWRRYVVGNPLFLSRVARQRLSLGDQSWLALGRKTNRQGSNASAPKSRFTTQPTHLKLGLWRASIAAGPYVKRSLDLVVSSTALILLLPLLVFLSIAVKVTSAGPVFFKQVRIGERGAPFVMWKFRSMRKDAEKELSALLQDNESEGSVLFKMKADPRITPVGRWMRRYSLDELPQLFNVLQGSMSLVGPRPALPSEIDKYQATHLKRLQAKPGLTCWWQVSGRSNLSFNEQMELDVAYLQEASLSQDLNLLAKTVPAVLSGKGAS